MFQHDEKNWNYYHVREEDGFIRVVQSKKKVLKNLCSLLQLVDQGLIVEIMLHFHEK
jgi:hypothetical protein